MDEGASKTPWSPVEQDARLRNGESDKLSQLSGIEHWNYLVFRCVK
ncbi:hypothetical protein LEP1GSC192_2650 [Leptospira sp. B5-022]|nr:hypothetical protein LEP1GSC192_2650 [Leptospira sp. B5-022]